jgi:hypothetical protein
MGGIELRGDELLVARAPSELDRLAIDFSAILEELDGEHVYVAGYVAILAGRPRATQDIDVLLEPCEEHTIERLVDELDDAGFWGPAMPLEDAYRMLSNGDNVWVAREDEMAPHLELKFVDDEFDRASLENAITARIGDASLPIGPLELQIAYKLYLEARKDFEDAVHLYTMFEESLSTDKLEGWVERLSVEDDYDRLKRA